MRSWQGLFLVALLVAVSEARVLKNETGNKTGNSTGCSKDPAVMNATKKLGEMDAGEDMDAFMDQVHKMRDAIKACRDKKADKAEDAADAEMAEYEDHPMMQEGLAFTTIENKIVNALAFYCQKADPKEKKADKGNSSKGDPCSEDCCKDKEVVNKTKELEKLEPGKKGFMKKVFELQDAVQACRAKNGKKAAKKADAAMKKYEEEHPLVDGTTPAPAFLEQDPCAGCDTGLAQAYQTCASKHGNPCAETNAAGIVGKGPGAKKDIGCCMKKEKHDRCLKCAGMDCAHGTCKVNKKYYSTYTIVGKLDDKKAMKKSGWGK